MTEREQLASAYDRVLPKLSRVLVGEDVGHMTTILLAIAATLANKSKTSRGAFIDAASLSFDSATDVGLMQCEVGRK